MVIADVQSRGRSRNPLRYAWFRRPLIALLCLFFVYVIAGYFMVVNPPTDVPRHVDAILVLGPTDASGRLDKAEALARAGYADNLVLSVPTVYRSAAQKAACAGQAVSTPTICFQPYPLTTRGEAEEIRRLAKSRGWKSLIVVTSNYHILRAETIVGRCFSGKVLMVEATEGHMGFEDWAYQYAYQTGAWFKVLTHRSC